MDNDKPRKKYIRRASGYYKHPRHLNRTVFISHNFSDVEDAATAAKVISEITSRAGKKAAAKRRKAGLSGIFIRNNQLISVTQNGVEKVVSTKPAQAKAFYINYKPSTVLHAVKK